MGRISKRRGSTNEQAIAKILDAKRNYHKAEDLRHPLLSVECKHRTHIHKYFHDWIAQSQAAATDDKLPIVVVHEHGTKHKEDIVIINLVDFAEHIEWLCDVLESDPIESWRLEEWANYE